MANTTQSPGTRDRAPATQPGGAGAGGPVDDALGRADAPATRAVPTGLAGRIYALRGAQAELDGETRMRRLLAAILIAQIPVVLVLLLSGAWIAVVIDVVLTAAVVVAALIFGPHDGDRHVPEKDEASDALIEGQKAEIAKLRAESARTVAGSSLLADLARRHRALLVRQLTKIDELEAKEQDPAQLSDLFVLDHLATRMRRCSEGVLVLSGRDEIKTGGTPVAASEVLRGAVAEIEDFSRVEVTLDRDVTIAGPAVVDVVHLLAEIIENATVFSSPTTPVRVHGHSAGDAFAVSVSDQGVGMSPERLAELNRYLAEDDLPVTAGQIGFQVVAKLAARHGIYVGLAAPVTGGTEATVVLPATLIASGAGTPRKPAAAPPVHHLLDDEPETGRDEQLDREFAAALADERPRAAVPVVEQPAAVQPPVDEPAYEQPVFDQAAYEQRVHDQAAQHAAAEPQVASADGWADTAPWAGHELHENESEVLPYVPSPVIEPVRTNAFEEPAPTEEVPAWSVASYDAPVEEEPAPFVSYEQHYNAEAGAQAPTWDDLAWPTPTPVSTPDELEPEGWRETTQSPFVPTARVVEEPAPEPDGADMLTRAGLRKRVPLANMAPQMAAPATTLADETVAEPAPDRSRHLFSAYRDGLTLGRNGLTSDAPSADNTHDGTYAGEDQ